MRSDRRSAVGPAALALVLAVLLGAGCGATAGPDYDPPYAVLSGTITSQAPPSGPVHVALVWLGVAVYRGAFQVAQDVPVEARFPTGFALSLRELPPAEAVSGFTSAAARAGAASHGLDPDLAWAQAVLLVYQDGNGNGRLDLVPPGQRSPDRVLGKAEDVTVWFLAGGLPAPAREVGSFPIAGGLSVTVAPLVDPQPGECAFDDAQGHYDFPCANDLAADAALLAPGAPLEIRLGEDPRLEHYTCQAFWGSQDWPDWASGWNQTSSLAQTLCAGPGCDCQGYACPLDLPPAGVPVTCNAQGTAYVYKTCIEDPDLCGTRFCHFGHGERSPAAPAPAGWPCPAAARVDSLAIPDRLLGLSH